MQLRLCFLEGLILVIFIVVTTIIARWGNAVGVPTEQNYPTNREKYSIVKARTETFQLRQFQENNQPEILGTMA